MNSEAPIRVKDYRAKHHLSSETMSSICRAMNLPKASRFICESQVNKWRREHPEHRVRDIYPRPKQTAKGGGLNER